MRFRRPIESVNFSVKVVSDNSLGSRFHHRLMPLHELSRLLIRFEQLGATCFPGEIQPPSAPIARERTFVLVSLART